MKVYIPQHINDIGKDYLRERGYEIKEGTGVTPEIMSKEIADCDAVIMRIAKLPASVMDAAPNLKVIARHGVGTDNIDIAAATARGIRVTNGPQSNAESVAEHTVAFMLALAHRLPTLNEAVHSDNWSIRNTPLGLTDLKGKTLGLVGSGRIAMAVAKKMAFGFDMKVITWGTTHPERLPDYVQFASSMEELFSQSDVVSLHCPLNDRSRKLVDARLLQLMKPTAFLINTARGEVVDEEALTEALKNHQIAGAAMDVMTAEPVSMENPLLQLQNVIFSPHCAALTRESMDNMSLHAAMGVHEVLTGQDPTWPVNML